MTRLFLALIGGLALLLPSCGAPTSGGPQVVMDTTMGKIKLELWPHKAPKTVENFLRYVDDKFYDNTIFHMLVVDSKIEAGGYEVGLKEKTPRDPIRSEAKNGVSNTRPTVAMALGKGPDSATSMFFINVRSNPSFDGKYTVFGHVIEGTSVCDDIRRADVHDKKVKGLDNVPIEQIVIKSIRRVESKK